MTLKHYLAAPSLQGEVVIDAVIYGDRPSLRLKATPFHVQGGGQKADRGTIGKIAILDVRQSAEGTIDHFVLEAAGLEAGAIYPFAINPEWRRLNSIYHSAGHLLAAICERMFPGVHATSGHHFPGEARVEFAVEGASSGMERMVGAKDAIEQAVRAEIDRDLPVTIVGDPYASRACQIGDFPPIACGGTHVTSTANIGHFSVRSIKRRGEAVRIGYELSP